MPIEVWIWSTHKWKCLPLKTCFKLLWNRDFQKLETKLEFQCQKLNSFELPSKGVNMYKGGMVLDHCWFTISYCPVLIKLKTVHRTHSQERWRYICNGFERNLMRRLCASAITSCQYGFLHLRPHNISFQGI